MGYSKQVYTKYMLMYLVSHSTSTRTDLKCAALPGATGPCAGEQVVGTTCMGYCTQPGMTGQTNYMCHDQYASNQVVYWKVTRPSTCTGVCGGWLGE